MTSQYGEDGIIAKALEVIGTRTNWCVEFGAWDGCHLSNTRNLIENYGYSAVLIEADRSRFQLLHRRYAGVARVHTINAFVGFSADNSLDALLGAIDIPTDFDLLSIDIDGNDYHIWESVQRYRPRLVVIEYNPTVPNGVEFVQRRDMRVAQGSSITSLSSLARSKSYELVAATQANAVFVDERFYARFAIEDNSVEAIRTDQSAVTYIFHGYDGTVFLSGCGNLVWHGLRYRTSKVQQLPRWLRCYPGNSSKTRKLLLLAYRTMLRCLRKMRS